MKRDVILETAARLFVQNGYTRTSTLLLAQEAGVAEGTIFRHFKSKEDLFIALILRLRETMVKEVVKYLDMQQDESGIDHIISTLKACLIFVKQSDPDFALLLRDAPSCYGESDSRAFELVKVIFDLLSEHFAKNIRRGQMEGNIRADLHPEDTACILTASMVGLMRSMHLGFLHTSDAIIENYLLCNRFMLKANV